MMSCGTLGSVEAMICLACGGISGMHSGFSITDGLDRRLTRCELSGQKNALIVFARGAVVRMYSEHAWQ